MGFSISFYNNRDELNKINKSPNLVMTAMGTLREETDIVNPVIILECVDYLPNCNYMRIPVFNRYYFIRRPIRAPYNG